LIHEKIKVK